MGGTTTLRKDCLSSTILLLLGGGYLWCALRYPVDTLENPGPGIFPLAIGVLLVVLAALQLVTAGRCLFQVTSARMAPDSPRGCPCDPPHPREIGRGPWIMVGALALYLLVVTWLGFLTCTFALVILCSKLMGTRGWGRAVLLAGGVVLVCHLLFSVWLKVPLPTGHVL